MAVRRVPRESKIRAGLREKACGGRSDAGCGAGDQRHSALQVEHEALAQSGASSCERRHTHHLVADDHESLVNAHARLGEDLVGSAGHGHMGAHPGRDIRLVAGPAAIGGQPVAPYVQQRLDRIVDPAKVRHFDVDDIRRTRGDEYLDVLEGVAPLIDDQLHGHVAPGQCPTQFDVAVHLGIATPRINGMFDAKTERRRLSRQFGQVVRNPADVAIEGEADGAIGVEMQPGSIIGSRSELDDPVAQPADVLLEPGAIRP